MKTVEDLLGELMLYAVPQGGTWRSAPSVAGPKIKSSSDVQFIIDLYNRSASGGSLSTKQAAVALKIIQKYKRFFNEDITEYVENPQYSRPLYQSTEVPREVRYIGRRRLAFKSKYSPQIVERLKSLRPNTTFYQSILPSFNKKYKVWVVEVTESNLEDVMKIISKFNFHFDEPVVQFLADCENAKNAHALAQIKGDEIILEIKNNELLTFWLEEILSTDEEANVSED